MISEIEKPEEKLAKLFEKIVEGAREHRLKKLDYSEVRGVFEQDFGGDVLNYVDFSGSELEKFVVKNLKANLVDQSESKIESGKLIKSTVNVYDLSKSEGREFEIVDSVIVRLDLSYSKDMKIREKNSVIWNIDLYGSKNVKIEKVKERKGN